MGEPFPRPRPSAVRLRASVPLAPPLAPPARVAAATAAAQEELGEDGGLRGSPQTTRRRCPRARRVPRRQRRALARGQVAWASASLRFLGSEPAASAGAAAAEAKAAARFSPPEQPKPREARRTGWWLAGVRCPRMGILFTRIWRLFNHQGEGLGPRASGWPGRRISQVEGLPLFLECGRRGLGAGCGPRGPGSFSPTSSSEMVPDSQPFVLGDRPRKSHPARTPIAPISVRWERFLV